MLALGTLMALPKEVQGFEYYIAAAGVAMLPSALCRILVQLVFSARPELDLVLSALLATLGGVAAAYLLSKSRKDQSSIVRLGTTTGLLSFVVSLVFGLVRISDWWANLFGYLLGGYIGVYLNKKLGSNIILSLS